MLAGLPILPLRIVDETDEGLAIGMALVARAIDDQFLAEILCFHRGLCFLDFDDDLLVLQ